MEAVRGWVWIFSGIAHLHKFTDKILIIILLYYLRWRQQKINISHNYVVHFISQMCNGKNTLIIVIFCGHNNNNNNYLSIWLLVQILYPMSCW